MPSDDRAKVIALVDRLVKEIHEHREKEDKTVAEIFAVLGGGGIGPRINRILGYWNDGWCEAVNSPTPFDFKAEKGGRGAITNRVKSWLTANINEGTIEAKIDAYFVRPDKYAHEQRYPFWLFARLFNTLQTSARVNGTEPSSDTRDRLQGLRGE